MEASTVLQLKWRWHDEAGQGGGKKEWRHPGEHHRARRRSERPDARGNRQTGLLVLGSARRPGRVSLGRLVSRRAGIIAPQRTMNPARRTLVLLFVKPHENRR